LGGAELLFGRIAGKLIPPVPQNAATNDGGSAASGNGEWKIYRDCCGASGGAHYKVGGRL
jgi:hypothetical protein